jgi:hypothetical protein
MNIHLILNVGQKSRTYYDGFQICGPHPSLQIGVEIQLAFQFRVGMVKEQTK